jgi:hypothetical protein
LHGEYNSKRFSLSTVQEDAMRFVLLLVMGGALSWPQEDEATRQAIAAVQKAEGKVVIDRNRPGHPVVGVDI